MNCPLCLDTTLDVTFHAGIELDICPRCRGVWLDRGELDRIAASAAASAPRTDHLRSAGPPPSSTDREAERDSWDDDRGRRPRDGRPPNKRKRSLASRLGDVFEEIIDM